MAEWKNVLLQLGEWMPDQSAWGNEDPNSTDGTGLDLAQNALYMFDQWKEVRGRRQVSSHVFGAGQFFGTYSCFCDFFGNIYMGTAESRLLCFNETLGPFASNGASFFDFSKGGAAYPAPAAWNVGDPRYTPPGWTFTIYGGNVIAAHTGGQTNPPKMQYRPMAGFANFADLVVSADEPRWAFIGTCKSFLVGGRLLPGGAGAYAGTGFSTEFGWSAINDPTNWTPDTTGTTQSGFAFLPDEDGWGITGLTAFPEFFLLFKDNSVTQVTYQGGALVWNVQVVASGGFGLGAAGWERSIVRSGRDCYYWSKAGPAVVIAGQYVQLVGEGKWRRYIADQIRATSGSQDAAVTVQGCYLPDYHQIVWLITNTNLGTANGWIVVYDIASYRLTSYQRGNDPGRGSLIAIPPSAAYQVQALCTQRFGVSDSAFDRVRMIETGFTNLTLSLSSFSDPASSLPITLRTKIWHPSADHLCLIQKFRLAWLMDPTRDGGGAAPVYPVASVVMEWSNDPLMAAGNVNSVTVSTGFLDGNGFFSAAEVNVVAGYFRFTVQIPSFSNAQTLRQVSGLEIMYVEDQLVR